MIKKQKKVFTATSNKSYALLKKKEEKIKVWSVSPSASHLIFKHLTGDKRLGK